jgi:hypothetical protein
MDSLLFKKTPLQLLSESLWAQKYCLTDTADMCRLNNQDLNQPLLSPENRARWTPLHLFVLRIAELHKKSEEIESQDFLIELLSKQMKKGQLAKDSSNHTALDLIRITWQTIPGNHAIRQLMNSKQLFPDGVVQDLPNRSTGDAFTVITLEPKGVRHTLNAFLSPGCVLTVLALNSGDIKFIICSFNLLVPKQNQDFKKLLVHKDTENITFLASSQSAVSLHTLIQHYPDAKTVNIPWTYQTATIPLRIVYSPTDTNTPCQYQVRRQSIYSPLTIKMPVTPIEPAENQKLAKNSARLASTGHAGGRSKEEENPSSLYVGTIITIVNHTSNPKLNGKTATVESISPDGMKITVNMKNQPKSLTLLARNCQVKQQSQATITVSTPQIP